jgi:hypothetical protein
MIRIIKSSKITLAGHVARIEFEECFVGFHSESRNGRRHSKDQDIHGRIVLQLILDNLNGWCRRISLTWDSGQWKALVNTVMNILSPQMLENSS